MKIISYYARKLLLKKTMPEATNARYISDIQSGFRLLFLILFSFVFEMKWNGIISEGCAADYY